MILIILFVFVYLVVILLIKNYIMDRRTYLERIEEEITKAGVSKNPQQGTIAVMWIVIEWMKSLEERVVDLQEWNTTGK